MEHELGPALGPQLGGPELSPELEAPRRPIETQTRYFSSGHETSRMVQEAFREEGDEEDPLGTEKETESALRTARELAASERIQAELATSLSKVATKKGKKDAKKSFPRPQSALGS